MAVFLLLKQANVPIYAGPLALALIRGKLEEHGLLRDAVLYEINHNTELTFKHMSVTFFKTTHSIPEPLGIVIHTPQGKVICTGDFKFDFTPVGDPADLHRMAALGKDGVLCLLSDSTNAEIPTFTNSEKVVGQSIMNIIEGIHGRIILLPLLQISTACSRLQKPLLRQVVRLLYLVVQWKRLLLTVLSLATSRSQREPLLSLMRLNITTLVRF